MIRLPHRASCIRGLLSVAVLVAPTVLHAQSLRVTLLGTGSPPPEIERFGPSTLVEAGEEKLVFDAGRGATQRLAQLGIRLGQVRALFLTHLHSDHIVGLPDLWLHRWVGMPEGATSLEVFGPAGTREMTSFLTKAFQVDISQRATPGGRGKPDLTTMASDIVQGVVFERNGVKVTAFDVDHGAPKMIAVGYRVDYAGRSLAISGDTRPSENLIRFAKGADVLIHEVMTARPEAVTRNDGLRRTIESHTTPEQAGAVFDRVKPRLAVYTHVSLMAAVRTAMTALAESLVPRTRTTYTGPLEVGEDLMTIEIGDQVTVRRPTSQSPK